MSENLQSTMQVRATCSWCTEEVRLPPSMVVMQLDITSDALVGEESYYTFPCPNCKNQAKKPLDERLASIMAFHCVINTGIVPA